MLIRTKVNGEWRQTDIWPGTSLLSMLRDHLGLVGSKNACEQGECGSCSVWLDGELVCACLVLAAQAGGRDVRTVESLAQGDRLHPVQEAFVEHGALQCGFCTPGMIMATVALINENPRPTADEVKHYMRGNICRCTGYKRILEAILDASRRMSGATAPDVR